MTIDESASVGACTPGGGETPPCAGLASNALPEAQSNANTESSQTGVSSDYAPKTDHHWYVLRITYNRIQKAHDIIAASGLETYIPMRYSIRKEIGKKKRIIEPLLPNLFFVYATRSDVDAVVKKKSDEPTSLIKFYLDKTKPLERNGKHPPLTISFEAMQSFIRATATSSEHVRIIPSANIKYKNGDTVRVIEGEFKGTVGRVARLAGQQRVVVEIPGLCFVATAYIPTGFIEIVK